MAVSHREVRSGLPRATMPACLLQVPLNYTIGFLGTVFFSVLPYLFHERCLSRASERGTLGMGFLSGFVCLPLIEVRIMNGQWRTSMRAFCTRMGTGKRTA